MSVGDAFGLLHALGRRRWKSCAKRCALLGKPAPLETDFITVLAESYNTGFKCVYCGKVMKFTDSPPYRDVASIDHYIPLNWGGTSHKDNLRVCCVACNIFKGTMRGDTFEMLYRAIGQTPLWLKMVQESFRGRFADKIERIEDEIDASQTPTN